LLFRKKKSPICGVGRLIINEREHVIWPNERLLFLPSSESSVQVHAQKRIEGGLIRAHLQSLQLLQASISSFSLETTTSCTPVWIPPKF
jgi:hypothetical protein